MGKTCIGTNRDKARTLKRTRTLKGTRKDMNWENQRDKDKG